ncbi:hypothetical protein [Dechloromonas denitrificans]|nr:hypothetical protein [Dechloromonas denitrificans]
MSRFTIAPLFSNAPPYFVWLLIWRALWACMALVVVVKRPVDVPLLVALSFLAGLLMMGEAAYRSKVYLEQERLRKERDRELREQRAEEARQRLEAFREAQRDADSKYMNLDLDEIDEPAADMRTEAAGGMSAKDFELATMARDSGAASPSRPSPSAPTSLAA